MSDSSSFTSLLDLVDNHLSKHNVHAFPPDSVSGTTSKSVTTSSLNSVQNVLSDTCQVSPGDRHPKSKFCLSNSPIQNVLAGQISNMLKAKERKEQEEQKRLEEEMNKLAIQVEKSDEYVIDLLTAIQMPVATKKPTEAVISRSSSFESLLIDNTKQFNEQGEPNESCDSMEDVKLPPILPCQTDISYILTEKVVKVRCSSFGKIFTARLRPVAAPYLEVNLEPKKVIRFNFKTKSPCDVIKEKLLKPSSYNAQHPSIMDIVMGKHIV